MRSCVTTKQESRKRCSMNNNVNKLLVAGLACVALCGTTLAAPRGGHGGRAPARPAVTHKVPAPRAPQHCEPARGNAHGGRPIANHAPAHHRPAPVVHHAPPPPRPAPVVVHHAPPPPPRPVVVHHALPPPPPPRPVVVHHHECDEGLGLGALLGAVIGGIVGSAL